MTRRFASSDAPHLAGRNSVARQMASVLLALLPGVLAHVVFFGPGILLQILLAGAFALAFEAAMLRLRARPLRPFLSDLSAPVTAVLFALCIPPLAPWWIALIGMASAIVMAKQLYGGLGSNLFNPAMVGYAVILVCFPLELTRWLPPTGLHEVPLGLLDSAVTILTGALPLPLQWDAIAQATPLDHARELAGAGLTRGEIGADPLYGALAGRGWEWVASGFALGGAWLLWRRVIAWQVPVATLATTLLLTLPFWLLDPDLHPAPLWHLLSGGLMLAAFFIATDPVTGCTTPRGRLLFGAGVAALTLLIRHAGAYPDGVAFAVLLMNCAAPWLDLHTRPRIFGESETR